MSITLMCRGMCIGAQKPTEERSVKFPGADFQVVMCTGDQTLIFWKSIAYF